MLRLKPVLPVCFSLAALLLAGCVSNGGPTAATGTLVRGDARTVAFESVDGPSPQVFDRLVSALDSEAKLRGIPVVSREGASTYRVRSYLSAQVRGKRTTIAWAWDVYDGSQQRALRLAGEETVARSGTDGWAAADDLVLRRIAQAGLTGLSGLLNGQAPLMPAPAPSPPPVAGPAVADNAAEAPAVTASLSPR